MAKWGETDVKPSRIGEAYPQKILSRIQLQNDDFQTRKLQIHVTSP